MRLLKRNLTEFEYLAYTGKESDLDPETGLHTGEPKPVYDDPIIFEGHLSPASYYANQELFGIDTRYTHVLIVDDPFAEIDEYGLIRCGGDTYEIRTVRRTLNVLSVSLRKQTKNHADGENG